MIHTVCYDVTDDRKRNAIARILADFGKRVQYSVFECLLDAELFAVMLERLKEAELDDTDSIRIYPLCARCIAQGVVIGPGEFTEDPDFFMV